MTYMKDIGIKMNSIPQFRGASFRFFSENEHHVTRICRDDVLLLVFDGILRFSEDSEEISLGAGEYYIQKSNSLQRGDIESDTPKYLYIHFHGEWDECGDILPRRGNFDISALSGLMSEMDELAHKDSCLVERSAAFFKILSALRAGSARKCTASEIASFISAEYLSELSLDLLCKKFHYSKNHIINIFNREYGMTPTEYINRLKLRRAEYLLEVTSMPTEKVATESGFNNYSHFYRLFEREHNLSPREWRKLCQSDPAVKYQNERRTSL